jgi:hypothetical protein
MLVAYGVRDFLKLAGNVSRSLVDPVIQITLIAVKLELA